VFGPLAGGSGMKALIRCLAPLERSRFVRQTGFHPSARLPWHDGESVSIGSPGMTAA